MGETACPPPETAAAPVEVPAAPAKEAVSEASPWFVLFGVINTYPGLSREDILPALVDPLFNAIAPGYPGTNTFTNLRDKGLFLPPQLAIGRMLGDHWALSTHFGYSAGKVRTKENTASILFGLPFHDDIELHRYAYYLGLDLDWYPLGAVELRHYDSLMERIRAAKPALGTRLTWTLAGFEAQVKVGFKPLVRVPTIRLSDEWLIPSVNLCAGVDIPWNERNVFVFNAGYNWFREEQGDFNGYSFTFAWRYFL